MSTPESKGLCSEIQHYVHHGCIWYQKILKSKYIGVQIVEPQNCLNAAEHSIHYGINCCYKQNSFSICSENYAVTLLNQEMNNTIWLITPFGCLQEWKLPFLTHHTRNLICMGTNHHWGLVCQITSNHYWCNEYFVPETVAYHISGQEKL